MEDDNVGEFNVLKGAESKSAELADMLLECSSKRADLVTMISSRQRIQGFALNKSFLKEKMVCPPTNRSTVSYELLSVMRTMCWSTKPDERFGWTAKLR
eukprot:1908059-Amphidinium_carterae.1